MNTETETDAQVTSDFMKFDYDSGTLTITLQNFDGSRLSQLQKALLLGVEEIGCCERAGDKDYQDAIWALTWLLRAIMLDESQTNVALGGKPFKKS
jgi:hypothetical protein